MELVGKEVLVIGERNPNSKDYKHYRQRSHHISHGFADDSVAIIYHHLGSTIFALKGLTESGGIVTQRLHKCQFKII
tara:strand:+ start:5494 stop:5724 length:231 start_codon:yes stop_codon:yes gene_type:complete